MMTWVPPFCSVGSSWLWQPVTWNSGTEMRLRRLGSWRGIVRTRSEFSALVQKFSWVVMAPLGKPVVPDV
jgi:hypothetical protein